MSGATSDEAGGEPTTAARPRSTWTNALVGAVVTVVTAVIPFSPALGGGVAGYLQGGTDRDGLRVGALAGLLAAIPLLLVFGLVVLVMSFGMVVTGEMAGPLFVVALLFVIALFVVAYTVVLSAVGGLVGSALADRREPRPEADEAA